MQYILLFLEGIITFISPCLLPMLPVYISYFAGGSNKDSIDSIENPDNINKKTSASGALRNSVGFVLGFTLIFIALGAFAGSVGRILRDYGTAVNIVTGFIVVVFGLNFLGILNISILNRSRSVNPAKIKEPGFISSVLFGVVFSIGWTPCVGAFLGSALMIASQQGSVIQGILMLLIFSMGLGIPFIASAVLIDKLKAAFDFIKRNYKIINALSGGLLIIAGILMMTGTFGYFLSMLTF